MINYSHLPKDIDIVAAVKLGGYYYWNWKFPFRHFKKEEIRVFTKNGIYTLKSSNA